MSELREPLELVGVPYLRGGDDSRGFDCFTLVRYVRARWFARATPLTYEPSVSTRALVSIQLGFARCTRGAEPLWSVCAPQLGCVVGLARTHHGRLHHCGVLVGEGVLHCQESAGVMLTPLDRLRELYGQVECFECRR